jgi:hypothetical protein
VFTISEISVSEKTGKFFFSAVTEHLVGNHSAVYTLKALIANLLAIKGLTGLMA